MQQQLHVFFPSLKKAETVTANKQQALKPTKEEFCKQRGISKYAFKIHDKSDLAREFSRWAARVARHGYDKPGSEHKDAVASLMENAMQLPSGVRDKIDRNKPWAGVGKLIYNRFLQVHRGYGYYGRAAADGEMVEVPVDEANDINAKAIEVITPVIVKAKADNSIVYVFEGNHHKWKHALSKVGDVLNSATIYSMEDLYLRLPDVPPATHIIEPLARVQQKKLKDKDGQMLTMAAIYALIKDEAIEIHLLQLHRGPKGKVAARLAETAAIREAKEKMPGRVMNVKDGANRTGQHSSYTVGMGVTVVSEKKLHAAGYTWSP